MSLKSHMLLIGWGFSAKRWVQDLDRAGWQISATYRREEQRDEIERAGVSATPFDDVEIWDGVTHCLSSVPPARDGSGDPVMQSHAEAMLRAPKLAWVGYLSSVGVYGDHQGVWVDEMSQQNPNRNPARQLADAAWRALHDDHGLPVHVFRLPGIYGPGRSPIERAASGQLQIIDAGDQVFNRVHVADIAGAVSAAIGNPHPGAVINICDDEPAPAALVNAHAYALLGMTPPASVKLEDAALSPMARGFYSENRRVRNDRMKALLHYTPQFPTYREGLADCFDAFRKRTSRG
ncbi:MAG: SDR family oxidoreductase [Pseudomonadota bacterium]